MYKLLIAEDEVLVRVGIKKSIDWRKIDFHVPLEASNGRKALEIIRREHIDVLLTDIKMPLLDGISLIKEIRTWNNSTEVIFLSCHNEFELVKEALKHNACDYLFKAKMMPRDIVAAIERAVIRIENRADIRTKLDTLEREAHDHESATKQRILLDAISGSAAKNERSSAAGDDIEFCFNPLDVTVAMLRFDTGSAKIPVESLPTGRSLVEVLAASAAKTSCPAPDFEVCSKSDDELILVTSEAHDKAVSFFAELIPLVSDSLTMRVVAGISGPHHELRDLNVAFAESEIAADKGFFEEEQHVFSYDELAGETTRAFDLSDCLEPMHQSSDATRAEAISSVFERIRSAHGLSIRDARELGSNILGFLLERSLHHKEVLHEIYRKESSLFFRLNGISRLSRMESFLIDLDSEISEIIRSSKRSAIYEAEAFMRARVGDPNLSLAAVAEHVQLSRSHLSRLFKSVTGQKFIDYVTRLRLERAEEIYRTTECKVYEVAGLVGFADSRYFSRLYKSHTGRSLSSLRRSDDS